MQESGRPRLAVYKLSSCAGCQLQILNVEDLLLDIAAAVQIAYFPMASRQMDPGPYDIGFVEGAVTSPEEIQRVKQARQQCRLLVALGSCAAFGGVPANKNRFAQRVVEQQVYQHPEVLNSVEARPVEHYVRLDATLRGCPIHPEEFLELVKGALIGATPRLPNYSLCLECRLRENACLFAQELCLGPISAAGCGALCPRLGRACQGCRGPAEGVNLAGFARLLQEKGYERAIIQNQLGKYAAAAPGVALAMAALRWEEERR